MKKYAMLYPPLVERIIAEEAGAKDPIKSAKTRLHQLYGAYVYGNTHKKAVTFLDTNDITPILSLHASTRERLPTLTEFYQFIIDNTSNIETIMDLGCGFNPFSISLMPSVLRENLKSYYAYDIDMRTRDILNRFFEGLNLPPTANCADLAVETPREKVDLALICKLLPVLESQCYGRGFQLAREINTRFLVITYPLKSLSGREKGMGRHYAASFEKAIADGLLGNYTLISEARIGNELVYILALI
ncbi:MAG: hypothetical protein FWE05_13195 [Defluviitaleaceae bacterium]|nr:hypothetical protein [Defluviitaleaceae bacterium]